MTFQEAQELIKKHGNNWAENLPNSKLPKVGDIYYTSWGYDQTNYDYMIVTKISPTGKTALCRMAQHENVGYSHYCYEQKPKKEAYGITFRMRIQEDGCLRGSYPYCYNDQSAKRRDWFYKAKEDETFYETDSQFGH